MLSAIVNEIVDKYATFALKKSNTRGIDFKSNTILKPSSCGDDMPGCQRNSSVTRNLEIRHDTIIPFFHRHS